MRETIITWWFPSSTWSLFLSLALPVLWRRLCRFVASRIIFTCCCCRCRFRCSSTPAQSPTTTATTQCANRYHSSSLLDRRYLARRGRQQRPLPTVLLVLLHCLGGDLYGASRPVYLVESATIATPAAATAVSLWRRIESDLLLDSCNPDEPPTLPTRMDCSIRRSEISEAMEPPATGGDENNKGDSLAWIPEGFCDTGLDRVFFPLAPSVPLPQQQGDNDGGDVGDLYFPPVPFILTMSERDICPTLDQCLVCGDWSACPTIANCGTDNVIIHNAFPIESLCSGHADDTWTVGDISVLDPIREFCQKYYDREQSASSSSSSYSSFTYICFLSCDKSTGEMPEEDKPPPDIILPPPQEGRGEDGEYHQDGKPYLGADTMAKKKAIVWNSRVAALLSFGGSTFILVDVLSHIDKRKTVYHQLLAMMACFDLVTAVAWSFASAAIPQKQATNSWIPEFDIATDPLPDHVQANIYGAVGTDATCQAQAFFIQLGYTSIFYNVSLSLYYLLVIVYGWREPSLLKIRLPLHGLPLLVGICLAFGILPVYSWIEYGCHLMPYPAGDLWKVLVFVVVPIGFSIVAITSTMLMVYWSVRQTDVAARKWKMESREVSTSITTTRQHQKKTKKISILTQVFWQSLLYTISFYITWPIMFAVYLAGADARSNRFGLAATVAFVAPLQGFNNFLVYVRPRITAFVRSHRRRTGTSSSTPTISSSMGGAAAGIPAANHRSTLPTTSADFSQSQSNNGTTMTFGSQNFHDEQHLGDVASAFVDPSVLLARKEEEEQHEQQVLSVEKHLDSVESPKSDFWIS